MTNSERFNSLKSNMNDAIEAFKTHLAKIKTGRANPSILNEVLVDYHGSMVPINQVASVVVEDSSVLKITPWEKNIIPEIEKAILRSDFGFNPTSQGDVIRIIFPALTEERRKEMIKMASKESESIKISIRSFRRDAMDHVKKDLKNKLVSEDEETSIRQKIDAMVAEYILNIDEIFKGKEKELLTI